MEGLEKTLQVEVTHVPSESSKVMDLRAVLNEPGHYAADLIPTAPGVYEFRVFGSAEGTPIDETFISRGGGGGFDDVRSAADLQFPERLPEVREIESAVRGALSTSQQAQDSALQAEDGSLHRQHSGYGGHGAGRAWNRVRRRRTGRSDQETQCALVSLKA